MGIYLSTISYPKIDMQYDSFIVMINDTEDDSALIIRD